MSCKINKKSLLTIGFLLLASCLFGKQAGAYLKKADRLNKSGNYEQAEKFYILAEKSSPEQGYYSARRGQFYLSSLKDYREALLSYEEAYRKGFTGTWMYIQALNCAGKLDDKGKRELWLARGLKNAEKQLQLADEKGKDTSIYLDNLLSMYGQYCSFYLSQNDFEKAYEWGKKGYEINRETSNHTLLQNLSKTLYWMSVREFGNRQWQEAVSLISLARDLVNKNAKLKERYYKLYVSLLEIYNQRMVLGTINPDYVHKVCVIILGKTEVDQQIHNKKEVIRGDVTKKQEMYTRLSVDYIKSIVESLSQGRISIQFTIEKPSIRLKKIVARQERDKKSSRFRSPDLDYLCIEHENFFNERLPYYDSFFIIWSSVEFNEANAGGKAIRLPVLKKQAWRGYVQCPSERIEYNGPDLLLHEFFHVIENMAGINPRHGYLAENRHHFAAWQGETDLEYYRWQLENNISILLENQGFDSYKALNFISRYPVKPYNP